MQHLYWRQIIIIFIFTLFSCDLFSQRIDVYRPEDDFKKTNLGISYGISRFSINYNLDKSFLSEFNSLDQIAKVQQSQSLFINLGLYGKIRLKNNLKVRSGFNMLVGDKVISNFKKLNDTTNYSLSIGSAILNIPVSLIYLSVRYEAFNKREFMRHYIFGGGKVDIDFTNTAVKVFKTSSPTEATRFPSYFKNIDLGYELGLGVSFYLRYATISPEIKFSYSLNDIRKPNLQSKLFNSINNLNLNYFSFTIHLEN